MSLVRDLLDKLPRIYKTMFGRCIVKNIRLDSGDCVRVLEAGGVFQSATYLDERRFEPVFSYYYRFDHVFDAGFRPSRVLMIGGGGYSWPKHVTSVWPCVERLDVVEIDAVVTSLARKYFYLDECMGRHPGAIGLIEADGRGFLENAKTGIYDCIVIDAFSGCEPVMSLASVEGLREASRVLSIDGVLAANVVSVDGGQDVSFLFRFVASMSELFEHVFILPVEEDDLAVEDNYIVYATNGKRVPNGAMPYDSSMLLTPIHDA